MNIKKYYAKKSLNYGISKFRELNLQKILSDDLTNKKILEIGCATGYFGKRLINRGALVYGIDISPEAISKAKKVLTHAITLDLEIDKIPYNENYFDLIIAAEVLEHLFAPKELLKKVHKLLKPKGELIISTPNILYWGNRIKFLRGKFNYELTGIFDEGHIHFFSYGSLKKELDEAGFKIYRESNYYIGNNIFKFIKDKYPGLFSYQFIISCKKKMETKN